MYITRALIGRNPCLDQAIQTRKTIVLLGMLGMLLNVRVVGNVVRVKKSAQNHSPSARAFARFS